MPESPWPEGLKRPKRFLSLRTRFIVLTSTLLLFLLGTLAFLIHSVQTKNLRRQAVARGLAVAESLGAAATSDLITYNYIALEQKVNQAVRDPEIVYVIIHDKEGRVGGFSGRPDLRGRFMEDAVTRKALRAEGPFVQDALLESSGEPILEVAAPVFHPGSPGSRWGTVRVAMTLELLQRQLRQTRAVILAVGAGALALGILVSTAVARRITHSVGELVKATQEAASGRLRDSISVKTGDEVEILAQHFSVMMREILSHREALERRLAEIRRLQRYTQGLLETMSDGLVSIDTQGNVSTANPQARRIFGTSEIAGASVEDFTRLCPEFRDYVERKMTRPEEVGQEEIRFRREDGEERVLLVDSSVLTDAQGAVREVIFNIRDITLIKHLEAVLRQKERLAALGTLAAGMAHEIRNPLSAIKTFVQLLPRKIEKPGFLEKFQRTVPRELERINRLVEDLLELARDPRYRFQVLDMKDFLREMADIAGVECEGRGVRCRFDFPEDLPPVRADLDQLRKAYHNLVRNAVESMRDGGLLRVEAGVETRAANGGEGGPRGDRSWLTLRFSDTGPGIPEEVLPHIFNPFFTTKDTGTGLGLAITHKVVTEHGGEIEVVSRRGEGTSFVVRLPACPVEGRRD